jgi:GNAT superfamily N-acetyltransferase
MDTEGDADTDTDTGGADLRPYREPGDRERLWPLKRAFERELGGLDEAKADRYEGKLTADYRERYLAWVERCVAEEPGCLALAVVDGAAVGYVFLLPESLAMIWDAAVLNELYVTPDHRGTGLATALVDRACEHARGQSLPLDRLVLDVDPANERAAGFYDAYGFEPWGEMVALSL